MRVVAVVLAGGMGTRLRPLTMDDAKPALPFARGSRIVDFVLSNLVNSGILSIYVLAQYKPWSLVEHIHSGWAPAVRRRGGFVEAVVPPAGECFVGTADAVYKNLHRLKRHRPELVAVFAADHVYRMDVAQMVAFHRRRRATITVAAARVPVVEASAFGVIVADADGRIREFQEKPHDPVPMTGDPSHAHASMGNYLFDADALYTLLEEASRRGETDFGAHILPRATQSRRAFAYDFAGNRVPGLRAHEEPNYWRDVGTVRAYQQALHDVGGPRPRFDLANPDWPLGPGGAIRGGRR